MTVSLREILAAARAHAAPLAAESAGYLLLAVADSVAVAPREVLADDVELSADGSVRLRASRARSSAEGEAELGVRRLLERALEVSSSVGPALRRAAAKREASGLGHLVRELETALIPVNRSAARRALARVHRETERARASGKLALLPDEEPQKSEVAPVALPPRVELAPPPAVEVVALAADFPEPVAPQPPTVQPPKVKRPVVVTPPLLTLSPPPPEATLAPLEVLLESEPEGLGAPETPAEPELTPEPLIAEGEPALTKPEPVVERARQRAGNTPKLGTVITAQTLPGEEADMTERAPPVVLDEGEELDIIVDVELPAIAAASQPLVDPEPSCLPDVLMAMVALHTGVEADEAPTRIRDVITAPREVLLTPEPEQVDDAWLTQSSLEGVGTREPIAEPEPEPELEPMVETVTQLEPEPIAELEPFAPMEQVEATCHLFESELAEPVVHEALTWDPGPVVSSALLPLAPALLIAAPEPEPSPYVPAVLPVRQSDVSELLDSFYVSEGSEERELRGALKEMAGLELTPMPHPLVRSS